MTIKAGIEYLHSLPLLELLDLIKEVSEVVDDRKRVQARYQNSRNNR